MTDDEARSLWADAGNLTREAQHRYERAARMRETVVSELQERGMGLRQIAALLGVAHHQQLHQIAQRAKARMDRTTVTER